jgi:ribonuclease G
MGEEILVNVTPMETRVAVVDNGAIQDIHIERAAGRGIVGNIYAGKVQRVLPGMQAAFVDIGTERSGFIHAADIYPRSGYRQCLPQWQGKQKPQLAKHWGLFARG